MASKKTRISGEVLYGRDVINLLHDFYLSSEGNRIMIVPSLNFDTPGLFKHCISPSIDEYDDNLYDVSNLDLTNGSLRIITDIKNHTDWQILEDFSQIPGIEIRNYKKIQMNLFAHLKDNSYFCIETPLIKDMSWLDFQDRAIAFKVRSSKCDDFLDFIEDLWEEADEIDFGD